jgi:hypothetical protein
MIQIGLYIKGLEGHMKRLLIFVDGVRKRPEKLWDWRNYGQDKYPNVPLYSINGKDQIESMAEGKYFYAALNFVKERRLNFGKPFSGYQNKDAAFFVQTEQRKLLLS